MTKSAHAAKKTSVREFVNLKAPEVRRRPFLKTELRTRRRRRRNGRFHFLSFPVRTDVLAACRPSTRSPARPRRSASCWNGSTWLFSAKTGAQITDHQVQPLKYFIYECFICQGGNCAPYRPSPAAPVPSPCCCFLFLFFLHVFAPVHPLQPLCPQFNPPVDKRSANAAIPNQRNVKKRQNELGGNKETDL